MSNKAHELIYSFFVKAILFWQNYNPFDIKCHIDTIISQFNRIDHRLDEINNHLENNIKELEKEADRRLIILNSISDAIPDMIWAKDEEGRYMYANLTVRQNLLLMDNPIGMTDLEIAKINISKYGDGYSFGQMCAISDDETARRGHQMRFLEHGKVKGRVLYLEVFKNVMRDKSGRTIGTCGSGRDMTEYVRAYRDESDIFKRYEFYDRSYRG